MVRGKIKFALWFRGVAKTFAENNGHGKMSWNDESQQTFTAKFRFEEKFHCNVI